ncbi:hypothetical protein LOD99_11012 [Oopsacas minuta]|uniref:Uncharacterized protein n=1 Tax=Oopsacas minuta TaxID=111878 RepID=A0AAV7KBN8_9METZ|nr:hypothetical protein LOD99_11012 [Oopsacas minuta]
MRARSYINERKLIIEVQPTSNSQPPEVGATSSVHSQDIQISDSPNVVDVSNTSSGVNIFTEPHVPDVTNSSPQNSDFIVTESAFLISLYDVGDILKGNVIVRNLSDDAKANYLSHDFTPGKNF